MNFKNINKNINKVNVVEYNGINFHLVGTNHADENSKNFVLNEIENGSYDAVAVELCEKRLQSFTNPNFKKPSKFKIINKVGIKGFMFGLGISSFYNILRNKHKIDVGGELIGAVKKAKEKKIPYELIDQDSQYTMLRIGIKSSYIFTIISIFGFFIVSSIFYFMDKKDVVDLIKKVNDKDKNKDVKFGSIKKAILDERDLYMANNLKNMKNYKNVLVVVGAAHVDGMLTHMKN